MSEAQETALVQISPNTDPRVAALYDEGVKLLEYATARAITSDEDVKVVTNDLSIISGVKKTIEERRQEYVGPLNEYLKAVNAAFKSLTAPLNEADAVMRQKVLTYRQEQEAVRQEEERINRLRDEAAQAEMDLKGEITEPVGLVEVATTAPSRYRTEVGTLGTANIRKWELVDLAEVPEEYKILDSARVTKVVKAGIPSIPGIRIYKEESLRVTPR